MAYGARLERGLGEIPQGFKSPILRTAAGRVLVPDAPARFAPKRPWSPARVSLRVRRLPRDQQVAASAVNDGMVNVLDETVVALSVIWLNTISAGNAVVGGLAGV